MPVSTQTPSRDTNLPIAHLDDEGWPVLPPTRLTIHRTSPDDIRDRQVIMSLDGKKICTLLYGQTFSCEILPGPHALRANNTLVWKTVTFDAEPGEEVHYTCINRAPGSLLYLLFVFGVGPLFVTLTRGRPGEPPAKPS